MVRRDEKQEEKPVLTPGKIWPDIIMEQLAEDMFLVYDRQTGNVETKYHVIHEGLMYKPLQKIPWPACCLPLEVESEEPITKEQFIRSLQARRFQGEYGDPKQLFNELKTFFERHLDVPEPLLYDVYAAWVMMTWRAEDFTVSPYLFFLGPLASGKTRGLEALAGLAYRSIMASSISAAAIFRVLETWHPTLFLDETEIYNREGMIEVLALLNAGYRKGQYAIRIEKTEEGIPTLGFFDVYGPKAMAGTKELAATLQSRAVLTHMSRNTRAVELFIDQEAAQQLRNKLLMYRFRTVGMREPRFDVTVLNGSVGSGRILSFSAASSSWLPQRKFGTG